MELDAQIRMLETALREHISRWERFFAGDLRVPPTDERERIYRRLRWLAEQPTNRREEQFRIEQLQHRFQAFSQNWERMLREREEGRGRFAASEAAPSAAPPAPPAEPRPDAHAPATVDGDGGPDLFDRFVAAKRELEQEVAIDRARFAEQIEAQRRTLTARLGCEVRFDVVVEDGKVKLAARRRGASSKESP